MLSFITLACILQIILIPTLALTIVYPFSHKAALAISNYITRTCARLVFATFKCYRKFEFEGSKENFEKLGKQFVIISNHQSLLDIVVYFKFFYQWFAKYEVRFVAKDALGKAPMVGKMLRTQGHCMIPRKGSPSVAMKRIEKFGLRTASNNQCPLIFPEGTRSKDGKLGTFYAAGFRKLVESSKLPVVVCALDGGWNLSHLTSIMKNLHKGSYKVKILKIYDVPQSKEDEKLILDEAPVLIQEQLDKWRSSN